jgi:Mrp family chromosome partitioning ATPase
MTMIAHSCAESWTAAMAVAVRDDPPGGGTAGRDGAVAIDLAVVSRCRTVFDALRVRLIDGGILSVVSPGRGEGRSTVAAGLAVAIAHETGYPVLLLDLDLERPSQAARFGAVPLPGLGDDPSDPRPMRIEPVHRGVWLLHAGAGSRRQNAGLVRDLTANGLLDGCRSAFAWTVVDLPPILDHAEAEPVAAGSDGFVVVGRRLATRVDALVATARRLPPAPRAFVMIPGRPAPAHRIERHR